MNTVSATPSIFDTQALSTLKGGLRKDDPKALKAATQQFEAVFLQMVMKSMRAATPQDGMFDSDQTRFYQELLDSQLAQSMSAKGGTGLAAMLERQLSRVDSQPGMEDADGFPLLPAAKGYTLDPRERALPLPGLGGQRPLPLDASPVRPRIPGVPAAVPPPPTSGGTVVPDGQSQNFVRSLWPQALAASRQTGIPPQFLLAQAALESGWGRKEPRLADGRPSYNLFGIKAGANWNGAVAESVTTEYVDGKPERQVERFRAYASYAEAFADHARLLASQPRYAQVLGTNDAAGFARALQNAGYASDPHYAEKLQRVIGSPALSMSG